MLNVNVILLTTYFDVCVHVYDIIIRHAMRWDYFNNYQNFPERFYTRFELYRKCDMTITAQNGMKSYDT